jgi:hypothetical protein
MEAQPKKQMIGRIYKICSPNSDLCYVGSTQKTLAHRLVQHKKNLRKWKAGKYNYTSSFEILCMDDAQIELIHEDEFDDITEMKDMEKYYVNQLNAVNILQPHRSVEERRELARQWCAQQVSCSKCGRTMARNSLNRHLKAHL